MNQKATRKITPAAFMTGNYYICFSTTKINEKARNMKRKRTAIFLLAAALPERKLNLLYRPFAKVGKAALMLYSVPFVLAWILMLFGLTPSSLTQFPGGDVVVILITLAAGWTGYLIRPI